LVGWIKRRHAVRYTTSFALLDSRPQACAIAVDHGGDIYQYLPAIASVQFDQTRQSQWHDIPDREIAIRFSQSQRPAKEIGSSKSKYDNICIVMVKTTTKCVCVC